MEGHGAGADGRRPGERHGQVQLLGVVTVHGPAGDVVATSRPQVQATLAYLLLERRPVARDELAELLWPHQPLSTHWKGAVRGVLSKVREVLGQAGIEAEVASQRDGTVRLDLPPGVISDVEAARSAVDAAEAALGEGDPDGALALVAPWVERLQQTFLPTGEGDWVRLQQDRTEALARRAADAEVEALLASGRPGLAAERARAWVRAHPLDEAVHEQLIRALVADGRRREAIQAHRELAEVLADELGVGPSAATTALVGAAVAGASGGGPVRGPAASTGTPAEPDERRGRVFLGRRAELDAVAEAWAATIDDRRPHLVLITGKSGIGKTRLAEEVAQRAADDGAVVRWARCVPGVALPFEPLASAVSAPGGAGPGDPDLARADALRAIDGGLRSLAAGPAVLVVDDLQWASVDVAAALEQTLVALRGPLLVLATARNLPAAVHDVLARLQRSMPAVQLRLRGLEARDLDPLFDAGAAPDADLGGIGASAADDARAGADELHRRTGGHPFFVNEIAIAPWRDGRPVDPTEVPDAVRDWIGHRADALPRRLRARLDLAAVIGDECSIGVMARCAHADPDEVLDDLEALVEDGFLVETDEVGVFAFPHLITRDAIDERMGATRRARMHAAVAEALAAAPPAPGLHAAIGQHLQAAGPGHASAAAHEFLAAGREALDSGAWSLAEQLYRAAGDADPDDPAVRAGALTGVARALHLQRRRSEAEDLVGEVLAIARAHRLPLELAEAVLVLVGRAGRGATQRLSDLEQAELLREALVGVEALAAGTFDDRDAEVRVASLACQLEGELALAVALTAPAAERVELAERALARARRLDPPDTHLTARALLISRVARLEPDQLPARLDDVEQVLAIAPSGRSIDSSLAALTYRTEDLLLCGDRRRAQASLAEAVELAERSQHPYWGWATATWRALDALIGGDLDEAEGQALAAAGRQGLEEGGAQACLGVNLVNIRLYQGRAGEVLELLDGAADAAPHIPCYRAVHALCAVEAGEVAAAERSYERFRADGFSTIPHDTNRLLTLVVLADALVQLGDEGSAPVLRELLAPAAHLQALLNCYGGGGSYWGPVTHQLARLEALAGDAEAASAHFAAAESSAQAMAAPLALARIVGDPVRSASSTERTGAIAPPPSA